MDWKNVGRTLMAMVFVAFGALLPVMTADWWGSVGVPVVWAGILGAVCLAIAAWWRMQEFEPGNMANVLRTLIQVGIIAVGTLLGSLSPQVLMSLGVTVEAGAVAGGTVALALAAWWRQQYPTAFDF